MNPQDPHMNNNDNNNLNPPRAVSYYTWNLSNLVPNPNCMPWQASAIVPAIVPQEFPWNMKMGFSSMSPADSRSTGSSANSDSGHSPDDVSVDSLINSLLRAVGGDDFNGGRNNTRYPSPVNGCRECTDVICEPCYNTYRIQFQQPLPLLPQLMPPPHPQQQPHPSQLQLSPVRHTRQIMPLHHYMSPSQYNTIRPMCSEIPMPIHHHQLNRMPLFCDEHRNAPRYYCRTCSRPFCSECGVHKHIGHSSVHLSEAIERASHQAGQILHQAQHSVTIFKEDLDSLQIAAEVLEQRARQATADVMTCVRRVVQAIEAREKDLIDKIEKCRIAKFESLKMRDEALRVGIVRLTRATDRLQTAMDRATLASNPFELLLTKDMAAAEVFQMRSARKNWQPIEENWISFAGPENNALHLIANMGAIVTSNPGLIGDRRTVRGRGNGGASPQYYRGSSSPIHNFGHNLPLTPIPRGRAIAGIGYPIVINSSLTGPPVGRLPVVQFGTGGSIQENLCRPWGVACDRDGHVIIADRSNNRIQVFRMDGTLVRRFGVHGTGPVEFDRPAGITVDSRRRIIVADKDNHRIQVLTMEGAFLLCFGEKGNRLGQFNYPWDVAVNSECQIVVSDTRNHRVQLFSPEGIFLRKYGFETSNTMWKNFDSPRGVSFNPDGNIAVTDFNNHRVVVVDSEFMNSRMLACDLGHGNRQMQRPQGLVVDDEGNIVVADSRNHRILIFDPTGTLKAQVGTADRGPDQMDRPSGLSITPDGRILVVDFGNNRVLLI